MDNLIANKGLVSGKIAVSVGGQVFHIPADKYGELLRILSNWNAIGEAGSNISTQYPGKQLLQG